MDKHCNKCGFMYNPAGSHYCGNCGAVFGDEWEVYDASSSQKYSRHPMFGLLAFIGALVCMAYVVIDWFYPELMGEYVLRISATWWYKLANVLISINALAGSVYCFRIAYLVLLKK